MAAVSSIIAGIAAAAGTASAVHGIETSREAGRKADQAEHRVGVAQKKAEAEQAEQGRKSEIASQQLANRTRQKRAQAGRGGRQSTLLTGGLGGDGGGLAGSVIGAGGAKTLLGA